MEQEYHRSLLPLEARVHRLEAMMEALLVRLGIDPEEVMPPEVQEPRAVRDALLAGNKIVAIKFYREFYKVGLKEAKDAIDAMERSLRG